MKDLEKHYAPRFTSVLVQVLRVW